MKLLIPYYRSIDILYGLCRRLNKKTRTGMLIMAVTGLSLSGMLYYSSDKVKEILRIDYRILVVLGPVFLLMILAAGTDRKTEKLTLKPYRLFWAGWSICFFVMLVAALMHPVRKEYLIWSVLSLTVIPMIWIVWSGHDHACGLIDITARVMTAMTFVFLLMNVLLVPVLEPASVPDYCGLCSNPNSNGLICTAFFTSALYLLITEGKCGFPIMLSLCLSVIFAVISVCRTAQLCMLTETVIAAFICVRNRGHFSADLNLRGAAALVLALMLSIAAGHVLVYLDKTYAGAYAATEYEDAAEWVDSDEMLSRVNDMSNGRLMIWKVYAGKLTLTGRGTPDGPVVPGIQASEWAHNNALDIGYTSGYIAMAGYLIWLLAGIVFVFRILTEKGGFRTEHLFTVLAFTGYFIQAMLEITLYPMITGIAFIAYISLQPVAFTDSLEQKRERILEESR